MAMLLRLSSTSAPRRASPRRIDVLLAAQDGDATVLPTLSAAAFEPALIQRNSPNRQIDMLAAANTEQTLAKLDAPGAWLQVPAHGRAQSAQVLDIAPGSNR